MLENSAEPDELAFAKQSAVAQFNCWYNVRQGIKGLLVGDRVSLESLCFDLGERLAMVHLRKTGHLPA